MISSIKKTILNNLISPFQCTSNCRMDRNDAIENLQQIVYINISSKIRPFYSLVDSIDNVELSAASYLLYKDICSNINLQCGKEWWQKFTTNFLLFS